MPKELKHLEKELHSIEIGFLKAVKDKNSNQDEFWKKISKHKEKNNRDTKQT